MTYCTLSDIQGGLVGPGKYLQAEAALAAQERINEAADDINAIIDKRYSRAGGIPRNLQKDLRALNALGALAKVTQVDVVIVNYSDRLQQLEEIDLPLPKLPPPPPGELDADAAF